MEDSAKDLKETNNSFETSSLIVLKAEIDSLQYQIKKLEEDAYAKNLQLAGQRQLVESLQEKLKRYEGTKQENSKFIEETQVWEGKYNEVLSKSRILEEVIEEMKKKSLEDNQMWEGEVDAAKARLRKVEEENFQQKKIICENEGNEAKLKKEQSEKEKLLKTLEGIGREKKELEENIEKFKEEIGGLKEKTSESEKKREEMGKDRENTRQELWKTQENLKTISEMLGKSEKFLEETNSSLTEILVKHQRLEEAFKGLEIENKNLLCEVQQLTQDLKLKITEVQSLSDEISRMRSQDLISFSIQINAEENNVSTAEELFQYKVKFSALETNFQTLSEKFEAISAENKNLKGKIEEFERKNHGLTQYSLESKMMYEEKIQKIQTEIENFQGKHETLSKYCKDLEVQSRVDQAKHQASEEKISKMLKENLGKDEKFLKLEADCKSYNSMISQLNSEKINIEIQCKQKEAKIKNISSKLSFYESQLHDKNKELITKENELMNADRQIDLLKKKINSSHSRIKQVASEQIDSQKKKIESNDSEIKMLKDMLKSVQSELKYKQHEILKFKKGSPPKKDLLMNSPLQQVKMRQNLPDAEIKSPGEFFKDSPFKKPAMNIFKSKSPFKANSRKDLSSDDPSVILQHVVKGYLTSYVLCEKEKKELLKLFEEEDELRRGILDKEIVLEKCQDIVIDTSLLAMYGADVDYKDFLEMHYHNQLQQIHRDLDINFSQVLPGSLSVSELKLIKQTLRPLHRQIWDAIVDRVTAEHPKEVDLYVLKQVLSQVTITL